MKENNLNELIPSNYINEPVEHTKEDEEYYKKYIKEKLDSFIGLINTCANFIGIKACINEIHNNQIDFYDINNNLLYSKKMEFPNNKMEYLKAIMGNQFKFEFNKDGNKVSFITNYKNSDNRIKQLLRVEYNTWQKELEITTERHNVVGIDLSIYGQDDFANKRISIHDFNNNQAFLCELNDAFGPKGNCNNGIIRSFSYINNPGKIYINVHEGQGCFNLKGITTKTEYRDGVFKSIVSRSIKNFCKEKKQVKPSTVIMLKNYLIAHPRTKETIKYLEDQYENEFPGIIDYIRNKLYSIYCIRDELFEENEKFEKLCNSIILPECDLYRKTYLKRTRKIEK